MVVDGEEMESEEGGGKRTSAEVSLHKLLVLPLKPRTGSALANPDGIARDADIDNSRGGSSSSCCGILMLLSLLLRLV